MMQPDFTLVCQWRLTSSSLKTMPTVVVIRLMSPPLTTTIPTKKLRSFSKFKHHGVCIGHLKPKSPLLLCPQHPLLLLLPFQPSRLLIWVPIIFGPEAHSHFSSLCHQRYGPAIGSHLQDTTGDRSHWWACSSDSLIYPSIFTFPLLSLHCWSTTMPPCWCDHTWPHTTLAFTSTGWSHLFDGQMFYNSHALFPFLVAQCVPFCSLTNHKSSHHAVRHLL